MITNTVPTNLPVSAVYFKLNCVLCQVIKNRVIIKLHTVTHITNSDS